LKQTKKVNKLQTQEFRWFGNLLSWVEGIGSIYFKKGITKFSFFIGYFAQEIKDILFGVLHSIN